MKTRTELLNHLIKRFDLKSYLEIGVQNPANNFDKVNAQHKTGIDPEVIYENVFAVESDRFFKEFSVKCGPAGNFDLIFIDGFHEKNQVKRDFDNALKCLNPGGFIVLHDMLPENEEGTRVPRETRQWWGDVYRLGMEMGRYPGIDFCTYDFDQGCMVVWKTEVKQYRCQPPGYDWNTYKHFGRGILNVVSADYIINRQTEKV